MGLAEMLPLVSGRAEPRIQLSRPLLQPPRFLDVSSLPLAMVFFPGSHLSLSSAKSVLAKGLTVWFV